MGKWVGITVGLLMGVIILDLSSGVAIFSNQSKSVVPESSPVPQVIEKPAIAGSLTETETVIQLLNKERPDSPLGRQWQDALKAAAERNRAPANHGAALPVEQPAAIDLRIAELDGLRTQIADLKHRLSLFVKPPTPQIIQPIRAPLPPPVIQPAQMPQRPGRPDPPAGLIVPIKPQPISHDPPQAQPAAHTINSVANYGVCATGQCGVTRFWRRR